MPETSGRLGWFDDLQRALAEAEKQKRPVLLFVRDCFGDAYTAYNWLYSSYGQLSLWEQMQLSGSRWLWQRYQEDFFARSEVAEAFAPLVRMCVTLDYKRMQGRFPMVYRRLDQKTQNLLVATGVLTDLDLAWRASRLQELGGLLHYDSNGSLLFKSNPLTSLSEVLSRERSALVLLSSKGELLYRFPLPDAQSEPALKEFTEQLPRLLAWHRTLVEGRANLNDGHGEAAIANFRALLAEGTGADSPEPLLGAVRQLAQSELDALERSAAQTLADAENSLASKDYEAAWAKAAPLEERGLVKVSDAVTARFQALKQAVEANAQQKQARRKADADQFVSSAQAAEGAQDVLKAYRTYKHLADNFGDLPQGAKALEQVTAWEADAAFMARLAALQAQSEAQEWLVLGNNYFMNHLYAQAIEQYTKVVEKHPDIPAAAEARTKLDQARALQAAEKKATEGQPAP